LASLQKGLVLLMKIFQILLKHKGCKGVGGYTVLACFGSMEVERHYEEKGSFFNRTFKFDIKTECILKMGKIEHQ
jgi:hypothetical protein